MSTQIKKLLVVALKAEWSHLKQGLHFKRDDAVTGLYHIQDKNDAALLQVGSGLNNSQTHFEEFLNNYTIESVFHFGTCGALDQHLQVGDLFVSQSCLATKQVHVDVASQYMTPLLQYLDNVKLIFSTGRLLTSNQVLKNKDAKTSLAQQFDAQAVDMESFGIAHACEQKGIDYLSVRGVFDTLAEDIESLGEPYDDRGNLKPMRLTANLIKSPKLILTLPHLQKRFQLINKRLSQVIGWYLEV